MSGPDGTGGRVRRRGVYLLPNLFTTAALFAGFYAIVAAMGGRYEAAAVAVYVAMLMDGLDGRVARLTQTQSEFGVQYDSLADVVSFGLAPALVVYQWALVGLGKPGWLAAFLYAACAALRLARFNTQVGIVDKRFFQGLASPPAAALVTGLVWVGAQAGWDGRALALPAFALTIAAGLLMVSNIRYYSFKDIDLKGRVPFMAAVAVAVLFAVVFVQPAVVLFTMAAVYALSGPVWTVAGLRRRRAARRGGQG
ncbi:CDP-diacylglycerol--serine O-phosphatidyltransferase [Inmirania thermothiophila]|uniref:CDP-diacylglycerol--serine O-phosphatidyltransferase n=1 Tax=Inmirania thermothiophila TaxID=1750597 RepID=A0A3N1Y968_9GAMM|nr:CDP-diacylglycerol--serine O-phosphatidyltransferase [Inmirania thermothiophila]ROR35091.1 CDP-diacylglycerol--serine O-phosphatidyltransferase [Inmirania thermothiophila]